MENNESNSFRISDSISYDDYGNFNNNFGEPQKKLDNITNGNKVSYSFKINQHTLTDKDLTDGDNIPGNPYFNTVWIGMATPGFLSPLTKGLKIIEITEGGEKYEEVGPGIGDLGLRIYLYVAVAITYNPTTPPRYDIKFYNYDANSHTTIPEKDASTGKYKVIQLPINTNNINYLPEFSLELGHPYNGETPVYFKYVDRISETTFKHKFINTLKKGLSFNKSNEFAFFGTMGSKGVIVENLQFNPMITDCDTPWKRKYNVRTGNKPSKPAPPPPPEPIYDNDMPQLYLTTYGNSAFKELSKIIQQEDILSNILYKQNSENQYNKDDKISQIKWYMMRDYNNKYFTQLKNFIVNKSNNIVNYMILMGDYAPILPPDIVENSSGTTMVIPGTCEVFSSSPTINHYAGPYALNSVNGPLDFGMSYNVNSKYINNTSVYE